MRGWGEVIALKIRSEFVTVDGVVKGDGKGWVDIGWVTGGMLALSDDRSDDLGGEKLKVILLVGVPAIISEDVTEFLAFLARCYTDMIHRMGGLGPDKGRDEYKCKKRSLGEVMILRL